MENTSPTTMGSQKSGFVTALGPFPYKDYENFTDALIQ